MNPDTVIDFKLLFENLPGLYMILSPEFNIITVSDAYAAATMIKRESVIGRHLFDVFPDNPDDKQADGVRNLSASLNEVIRTGKPHVMAIQKYDVRRPDGVFEERYWSPRNSPLFNEQQQLVCIIHDAVDVTEQRKTDEKLRIKERDYQLLVSGVKDYAIFKMDADGLVATWNSGAELINGYKEEEILGKHIDIFYTEEDKESRIPQHNLQLAQQFGRYEAEGWRLRKDGSRFWANTVYTALYDDEGTLYGFVKITRDISLRKRLEEQLKKSNEELEEKVKIRTAQITKSERRFRALIENSNDIITLMDASFKLIYRSPAATRILGWTNEDMLGVQATKNIHPEDQPEALEIVKEVMANPGIAIYCKFRMHHKKGHYLWVEGTLTNLLGDKDVNAIVFNFRNVTERVKADEKLKEREKLLQLFIEHSPASQAMLDDQMNYIAVSKRWLQDYNLTNQDLTGKSHYEVFPDLPQHWKEIHQRCLKGAVERSEEDSMIQPDGERIWIRWEIRPWYRSSGKVGGVIIFSENITERKKTEKQRIFDANNLSALINNTHDLMWSVDKNFRLITSNKAFDKEVKSVTGEIPKKGTVMLLDAYDKNQLERYKKYYERALQGETFTEVECIYGIWFETSFYPIREGDKVIGTACYSRDITEKKHAEQELARSFEEKEALAARMSIILNTLPANIALLDSKGYIIDINNAWLNFSDKNGFIGNTYGIGDNYLRISDDEQDANSEHKKNIRDGISAVLGRKIKEFIYEYPCHSPTDQRWFRMIVTPLQEEEYSGAVVMHTDISELRRLEMERMNAKIEEQKNFTQAMLIGQERERNHIAQELHDNVTQLLVGTKLQLNLTGAQHEDLKEALRYPTELVGTSIEEIRALCRKMVTPLKDKRLKDLVLELLKELNQHTGIQTHFDFQMEGKPLPDDLKLNSYRIIQELVNNIMKYAEAGQVHIDIKGNQEFLTIVVTDDGVGFDTHKKREGIGISNIINRAQSFGGVITIESSPGKGCKTSIRIPVQQFSK